MQLISNSNVSLSHTDFVQCFGYSLSIMLKEVAFHVCRNPLSRVGHYIHMERAENFFIGLHG